MEPISSESLKAGDYFTWEDYIIRFDGDWNAQMHTLLSKRSYKMQTAYSLELSAKLYKATTEQAQALEMCIQAGRYTETPLFTDNYSIW